MALAQSDLAAVVGTIAGEALKESFAGQAAVADVIANRANNPTAYGAAPNATYADIAKANRGDRGMKQFDAWWDNPSVAKAHATATMFERAIMDPTYADTLNEERKQQLEQMKSAALAVLENGSLRGIAKGATFYNNPAYTSASMNEKMSRYGVDSMRIGGHVFRGPDFDASLPDKTKDARVAADLSDSYAGKYASAGEISREQRAMEAQRATFQGPSDFGAPVWDGTWDPGPSLAAAPVGPVESAPLPDLGYQPGPDLGGNLSTSLPSSDFAPNIDPYGFSGMSFSTGMNQVQDQLSQTYAGTVPGGGTFAPDTNYAPGPDLGANLNSAVPSSAFGMDVGPTSFSNMNAGSMGVNPGFGGGITPDAPKGVNDALTIGRDITVGPLGYAGTNGYTSATSALSPNGTKVADMPSGMPSFAAMDKAMQFDPATFSFSAPAAWSDEKPAAPAMPNDLTPPSEKKTDPALPGYELPPEIAPPTSIPNTVQAPSRTASAPAAVPSSSPTTKSHPATTAVPSLSLPSLPTPVNIPNLGISPNFDTPAATSAGLLSGWGTPDSFLGGIMNGNMSGIQGLSAVTGTDYSGLASRAQSMDQYAQPAMLGLERAYADATGQKGPQGLFDGLFSGWSFGFGGDSSGLGTTPGAGGLY